MRYSQTTQNFYPDGLEYPVLPDDIIVVPQADYDAAIYRQPGATLDVVNGRVVIIPKADATLAELKIDKINAISAAFLAELAAGFITTSGIKMDANITDVQLLKSAYDLAALLEQTTLPLVVDYDNVVHANMPMADVLQIIIETAVHYQTVYAHKQTLRGQAMAAATETELNEIIWT